MYVQISASSTQTCKYLLNLLLCSQNLQMCTQWQQLINFAIQPNPPQLLCACASHHAIIVWLFLLCLPMDSNVLH
jgi:hypothetical protein